MKSQTNSPHIYKTSPITQLSGSLNLFRQVRLLEFEGEKHQGEFSK
jgi:hypothetical protein